MPAIRKIHIENFRSIKKLDWFPSPGINCLIGPGDAGKSTILDAIDKCLNPRRYLIFSDADFYNLDVTKPIKIIITLGALPEDLSNLKYGDYLRGFDETHKKILDEPGDQLENVLSIQLTVDSDLVPSWTFISDRQNERTLSWKEKNILAVLNLSSTNLNQFTLQQNSILNTLIPNKSETKSALINLSRQIHEGFSLNQNTVIEDVLKEVHKTAQSLGIVVGDCVHLGIDPSELSVKNGNLALLNSNKIPLQNLGTGSARLLIAGLRKLNTNVNPIVIVDEVEHGLEPHRLISFLLQLRNSCQTFISTHSTIPIVELDHSSLFIVSHDNECHSVLGIEKIFQRVVRSYPYAFLAKAIICCEGKCEVGLLRGIDDSNIASNAPSFLSKGVVPVDAAGGTNFLTLAENFEALGYQVCVFMDNDVNGKENGWDDKIKTLNEKKIPIFTYQDPICLETAIAQMLGKQDIKNLIDFGTKNITNFEEKWNMMAISEDELFNNKETVKQLLCSLKQKNNNATLTNYRLFGCEFIAPLIKGKNSKGQFIQTIENILSWANDVGN